MFKLDQELIVLMKKVELEGYQIYAVGGFVRDFILNRKTRDLDLATSMPIKHFKELLKSYEIKDFNEQYGTIKFELKTYEVEVTQFRKEKGYKDSRHPDTIEFTKELEMDVLRRDFTMNALYMNKDGTIFDPQSGLKDIEHETIKTIRDAKLTFSEDALRIVRMYRFLAELDFKIEDKTLSEAQELLYTIKNLKKIQIKSEAIKILSSKGFNSLHQNHLDFLSILFSKASFPKEVFLIDNSWEYKLLYMYELNDLKVLLNEWQVSSNKKRYLIDLKIIIKDYKKMPLEDLFVKHGSFIWFEMMTLFLNLNDKFIYRNKFIKILNANKTRTLFDLNINGTDLVEMQVPEALRNQILMKLLFDHIWKDLDNENIQLIEQAARYKNDIH